MSFSNEKSEKNRLQFDDVYWELCVLQACCWGAYHILYEQYNSRFDDMEIALLHEFRRFKEMLANFDPGTGKGVQKGNG